MGALNMKKTTLYLDWDSVVRVRAALERLPGNLSLSSLISEQLPNIAGMLEQMADAYEGQNMEGFARVVTEAVDEAHTKAVEVRKYAREKRSVPPKQGALDVPASKPKRTKKVA